MTTSLCHFNIFDDKDAKSICNSLGKINSSTISTVYISDATDIGNYTNGTDSNPIIRVKLNSYANMPVVGSGAYVISHSGETADVKAYDPKFGSTHALIVDAAV